MSNGVAWPKLWIVQSPLLHQYINRVTLQPLMNTRQVQHWQVYGLIMVQMVSPKKKKTPV
jgi:hypothetical protein